MSRRRGDQIRIESWISSTQSRGTNAEGIGERCDALRRRARKIGAHRGGITSMTRLALTVTELDKLAILVGAKALDDKILDT